MALWSYVVLWIKWERPLSFPHLEWLMMQLPNVGKVMSKGGDAEAWRINICMGLADCFRGGNSTRKLHAATVTVMKRIYKLGQV
jgi:hypothetical protein